MKCSRWAIVIGQCLSCVVYHAVSTIFFKSLLLLQSPGPIESKLGRNIRVTCRSKIAKIILIEMKDGQDGHHGGHLENLFFASSPEPKGHLTWNVVGSIWMTCRLKIAKIVSIRNPRWPLWRPSWKSIFRFFSWTKRPIDLKLGRKHRGDL